MSTYLPDGLESKRLRFRKIVPTDMEFWLPFHEDPRTSEFWAGLPKDAKTACTEDLERTFYRYENNLGGKMALISKSTDEFIGQSGLLVQKVDGLPELEIAYSLLPKFWKRGYAIEAAMACKAYAQANRLSDSLISIIHIDNIPSQRVALKNGMKHSKTTGYHGNPVHIFRIQL